MSAELAEIALATMIRLRDTRDAITSKEHDLAAAERNGQKRKAAQIRKEISELRLTELCGRMVIGG